MDGEVARMFVAVATKLDEYKQGMQEVTSGNEKMKQHTEKMTGFMEKNWLKVSVALTAVGVGIEAMARKQAPLTESTKQLAAATGMTEKEMRTLVKSTSNVTFSLDEVLGVMERGRQQGIKSAEGLKQYAEFWDMVGDATGQSAETLAEASSALRAVGIDAGNEAESVAAFGYITQETTSDVSEFLAFLERTGPELRQVGMDIDDAAAVLGILEHEFGMAGRTARQEFRTAVNEANGDINKLFGILGITEQQFANYTQQVEDSSEVIARNAEIHAESYTVMQKLQHWTEELAYSYGGLFSVMQSMVPILMISGPLLRGMAAAKAWLNIETIKYHALMIAGKAKVAAYTAVLLAQKAAILGAAGAMGLLAKGAGIAGVVMTGIKVAALAVAGVLTSTIGIVVLVVAAVAGAVYLIVKYWDEIKEAFFTAWSAIKDYAGKVIGWMMDKWTAFKEAMMSIWDAISAPFKAFLNVFIRGINLIIDGLNKISFKVPDWVPSVGGQHWGFNIEKIPELHGGGIYRAPQPGGEGLALLKDRETVIPAGGAASAGVVNNFNISAIHVREDADIEKIARQLYLMQRESARGVA